MPTKKIAKKTSSEKSGIHEASAFDVPVTQTVVAPAHNPRGGKVKAFIGISFTIIVIFITCLNYFLHYQKNQELQRNPVMASEMEQKSIVSKVAKLIELPNTEAPTIATVTDITKLQGQPFFQHAKNGDIVLIYPKANEAILYDPTANRILELGPISNNSQANASPNASVAGASTQAVSITSTLTPVTVALYNGTTINGLTRKIQAELAQSMPSVTVVDNTNASKQDYTNTIVIDLTGKQSANAKQLATILHGTVGSMPSTETVPVNADILVILGKNY